MLAWTLAQIDRLSDVPHDNIPFAAAHVKQTHPAFLALFAILHKLLSLQNLRNQEQGFRKLEFQVKDSAITWGGFNIYDGNIF